MIRTRNLAALCLFGLVPALIMATRAQEILTPQEKRALERSEQLHQRIGIYLRAADSRLQGALADLKEDRRESFTEFIRQYQQVLQLCSADMDRFPAIKSGQAKSHEIELRRQIKLLEEFSIKADSQELSLLRSEIGYAHQLRNRFLKIFFGSETIKDSRKQEKP